MRWLVFLCVPAATGTVLFYVHVAMARAEAGARRAQWQAHLLCLSLTQDELSAVLARYATAMSALCEALAEHVAPTLRKTVADMNRFMESYRAAVPPLNEREAPR